MTEITINEAIGRILPKMVLGCIECDVHISTDNSELWKEIDLVTVQIGESFELDMIGSIPAIKASRQAYRLLGKDPARYRLSAEALMRRAVKGLQLYRVNNVVDLVNLVSLKTGFSIGGYDVEKIAGNIFFDIGRGNEP